MCIFGAKSPKMIMLTLKIGENMKKLLSALALVAMSSLVYAGGNAMSDGNNMSSAKASSGVHFMEECTLDMTVQLVIQLD